jgi:hypothetical protein
VNVLSVFPATPRTSWERCGSITRVPDRATLGLCVGKADPHHVQVGAVERISHLVDAQHALLGRGQRPAGLDSTSLRTAGSSNSCWSRGSRSPRDTPRPHLSERKSSRAAVLSALLASEGANGPLRTSQPRPTLGAELPLVAHPHAAIVLPQSLQSVRSSLAARSVSPDTDSDP